MRGVVAKINESFDLGVLRLDTDIAKALGQNEAEAALGQAYRRRR
jgi:hypothetical protein